MYVVARPHHGAVHSLVDAQDAHVGVRITIIGLSQQALKIPADGMALKRETGQCHGKIFFMQHVGSRPVKDMDQGMLGQLSVGYYGTLVISRQYEDRDAFVGNLFQWFESHFDQPGRHLAAEQNISAVDDTINVALQGRKQGLPEIGKKFRSTAAALYARSKRKIEAQV